MRQILNHIDNKNKIHLSTDFEGCNAFEVCDAKNQHLGESLFNGRKNKNKDDNGKYGIVLKP